MLSEGSPLILGSRSPRRRDILQSLGVPFVVQAPAVDESQLGGETPELYVERIAQLKLEAVRSNAIERRTKHEGILVADTTVSVGGRILGKPRDREESLRMITALSGTSHRVLTSYALEQRAEGRAVVRTVQTEVRMRQADAEELAAYVATGEGMDKAGGYAIQGRASFLVESISGSYSNVVGLPVCELVLDLKKLGLLRSYP